jgi:hypothetical protein
MIRVKSTPLSSDGAAAAFASDIVTLSSTYTRRKYSIEHGVGSNDFNKQPAS